MLSKTSLGDSSIGRSFVEIGVGATTTAIGSSNYSETVKAKAMEKARKFQRNVLIKFLKLKQMAWLVLV